MKFHFRSPGSSQRLSALLARACPELSRRQITEALRQRRIRVNDQPVQDAHKRLKPGDVTLATLPGGEATHERHKPELLEKRGQHWLVRTHPNGVFCNPEEELRTFSALLGQDPIKAVYRLPPLAGGLILVQEPATKDSCTAVVFHVMVPVFPWTDGVLRTPRGEKVELQILERRGDVVLIRLECSAELAPTLDEFLANMGYPALGDPHHGGIMVEGGLRIHCSAARIDGDLVGADLPPEDWWPDEALFTERGRGPLDTVEEPLSFQVSQTTGRILKGGHPWILLDDDTDDPQGFAPGTLVKLTDGTGDVLGNAQIDWSRPIAARVWSGGKFSPSQMGGLTARVDGALDRRRKLLAPLIDSGGTTAYRLIHGESDGLPGLFVDRLGPGLRVLVQAYSALDLVTPVVDQILDRMKDKLSPNAPVIRVLHLRPKPPGQLGGVSLIRGRLPDEAGGVLGQWAVRERGQHFLVDVGLRHHQRPTPGFGLFLDQRDNRERLDQFAAEGGHWLNLFCHTGAFSVSLLAAGADQVTSVDLSKPYLDWLQENLRLNGLETDRHVSRKMDARRFLEQLEPEERFRGIILDPPTAAAAGRQFWSVKREVSFLIGACLKHLEDQGVLLVCRNDRKARKQLSSIVQEVAQKMKIELARTDPAPPGPDFPRIEAFPEGDSFQGLLVQRRK